MESPINLSSGAVSSEISNTDQPRPGEFEGAERSQSAVTASSDQQQAGSRENLQRPLRFRYPLVSLKRLKTIGPARRVLVSNTEADESLPKPSEEENVVIQKLPAFSENEHVATSIESAASTENLSPEQGKATSSTDQRSGSAQVGGGNYELSDQRKRKADIETIAEDTSISLTVNMESVGSPSQNNPDLRLDKKGCDFFGSSGLGFGGNFQKFTGEHNISVNSSSVYHEEAKPSAYERVEDASGPKYVLKQLQEMYDASHSSEVLEPAVLEDPKKVHFATLDSMNRGESMEFPSSCITKTQKKQVPSAFHNKQLQLKPTGLLKHAADSRSTFSISFPKEDSTQSKPHPSLIREHKYKEMFATRGQSVSHNHGFCCIESLKSDCHTSNSELNPIMSYGTQLPTTAESNILLAPMSSTPLQEKLATDSGVENLSSHMNSLALTENQGTESLNNLGESFANHQQNLNQAGLQCAPKSEVLMSKAVHATEPNVTVMATAAAMGEIKNLMVISSCGHEVKSSSTMPALKCVSCTASAFAAPSATSVLSTSAPLTFSSVHNLCLCKEHSSAEERGALGVSNGNSKPLDPQAGAQDSPRHLHAKTSNPLASSSSSLPFTTSAFAGQSATSIRCTSGPFTSLSIGQGLNMPREQSSSSKENGVRSAIGESSNARLQESRVLIKSLEERVPQEPRVVAKANGERCQPPEVGSSLNKAVVQPSSQNNSEKATSSIETGANRKRHHDPDAFFRVNNKTYQKLGKIGSGGSSEVLKVISTDCTIYALKKIKLKGRDYSTAYGFCQEIDYLTRLRGKNYIIQLIDYEVTDKNLIKDVLTGDASIKDGRINEDAYIYMVLEYGEIDLAQMLLQKWKEIDAGNKQLDENWLRFYWQQILRAVNTIHEERIVHSDLKPANFLLVKGVLKLIDFGIAKAIQSDTTNIQRDSQVGTLNYMSPEAFMCNDQDENGNTIKCGRPSDIWSLGCILYQMVYGRTPFADFNTFWTKYKEITNKDHKITYNPVSNPWLLDIMKKCLAWNRNERLRIPQLLEHPFLQPPAPPLLLTQEEQYCKALHEISQVYGSVAEIRSLCDKLQENIKKLAKPANR